MSSTPDDPAAGGRCAAARGRPDRLRGADVLPRARRGRLHLRVPGDHARDLRDGVRAGRRHGRARRRGSRSRSTSCPGWSRRASCSRASSTSRSRSPSSATRAASSGCAAPRCRRPPYFLGKIGAGAGDARSSRPRCCWRSRRSLFDVPMPTTATAWAHVRVGVRARHRRRARCCGVAFSSVPRSGRSASAVVTPDRARAAVHLRRVLRVQRPAAWMQQVASVFPLKWMAQGMRSVFLPPSAESLGGQRVLAARRDRRRPARVGRRRARRRRPHVPLAASRRRLSRPSRRSDRRAAVGLRRLRTSVRGGHTCVHVTQRQRRSPCRRPRRDDGCHPRLPAHARAPDGPRPAADRRGGALRADGDDRRRDGVRAAGGRDRRAHRQLPVPGRRRAARRRGRRGPDDRASRSPA